MTLWKYPPFSMYPLHVTGTSFALTDLVLSTASATVDSASNPWNALELILSIIGWYGSARSMSVYVILLSGVFLL